SRGTARSSRDLPPAASYLLRPDGESRRSCDRARLGPVPARLRAGPPAVAAGAATPGGHRVRELHAAVLRRLGAGRRAPVLLGAARAARERVADPARDGALRPAADAARTAEPAGARAGRGARLGRQP